jgi:hypothetical protein
MKTFHHILVPMDFSDSAREALHVALDLKRGVQTRLSLVHVIPDVWAQAWVAEAGVDLPSLEHECQEDARKQWRAGDCRGNQPELTSDRIRRALFRGEYARTRRYRCQRARAAFTAITMAACSCPFDAMTPSLRTNRDPALKSSGRPSRSVTRPPASSMINAPAA